MNGRTATPNWDVGLALGVGDLAGGHAGARFAPRLSEALIGRLLGLLVVAVSASPHRSPPASQARCRYSPVTSGSSRALNGS
jgi:hypothetical protein